MAKIKYDVSEVEDSDFKAAPVGMYRAKIKSVDGPKKSSTGNDMLEIVLELTHDSKGKKLKEQYGQVWHYVPTNAAEAGGWAYRLKEFLKALGLKEKGTLDTDKMVGQSLQVQLKADKDLNDEYRPKVGKLIALADEPEDEDDDDEGTEPEDDDDDSEDDDEQTIEEAVAELDRKELKAFISENELDVKVKKSMDEDAIREAIVEAWPEDDGEDDDDDDDEEEEGDEDEAPDYSAMPIQDLKNLAKERGLEVKGKKADYIKALQAHDDDEEPF